MARSAASIALKRIVVPTDFSLGSAAALRYAAVLARKYDATIYSVHTLEPEVCMQVPTVLVACPALPIVDALALARNTASAKLGELARLPFLNGLRHETVLQETFPSDIVPTRNFDIVVMASHAPTGLHKLITGSVAEETLRAAFCPVLLVGPKGQERTIADPVIRNILFVAGGFPVRENRALHWTTWLSLDFAATVTLLELRAPHAPAPPQAPKPRLPQSWHRIASTNTLSDAVLEVSNASKPDLIVVGVHSKSENSIQSAYRVMLEAACPVLTVRASWRTLQD